MITARIFDVWKGLAICVVLVAAVAGAQTAALPSSPVIGVRARLDKNLDANKVKVGDAVVAKPEVKIHVASGVDLATNSRLLGRVDTVKQSVDKGDSEISVTFYKAQLKDGRQIPIKATILWIGQPPNQLDPAVVSAPADRTTPGVGEATGRTGAAQQQGYLNSDVTGPAHQHVDPSAGGGAQLPEGLSSQANAIPGVNFFSDMGRSDSGWFRSKGRSVFVPGGTVLAFAIVALPG